MLTQFRLRQRNNYPWIFGTFVIVAGLILIFQPTILSPEFALSITAAVAAFVHFLYSQHNHNTEQFISLFREFNARYDRLNDRLNALALKEGSLLLEAEDKQLLYDYFNLCAEEYLYFKSGYIDAQVWRSWLNGMKYFAANPEVRRLWQEELESGSYYGFSLSEIDKTV